LIQDIRYGLQMLLRNPGFTVVTTLALALGIGANTAIFSVVNGVILRPLPYDDPDRLVMVWEHNFRRNRPQNLVSRANYFDWKKQNRSFEDIAAFSPGASHILTIGSDVERISGETTSANYFSLLGLTPILGRTYTSDEDLPNVERVVVLSQQLWQRRFSGDPGLLGQSITLSGNNYTVIGILPSGQDFFDRDPEFWVPFRLDPTGSYEGRSLTVVGRLKTGVSMEQARTEMTTIASRLEQEHEYNAGWGINLVPLSEQIVGDVQSALLVLLGAVGFVLLIACANVTNLLLARTAARQREIAIRVSMGASRWRVVRQLLTESGMLAGLGGLFGILFAIWGLDLLVALSPENVPRLSQVQVDTTVLGFTAFVAVLTGLIFGTAAALSALKTDPNDSLKEGGRNTGAGSSRRARSVLVVFEMALSLVLLICAGLMIKSFLRLQELSPGFRPENVLTLKLSLPGSQYEPQQRVAFYEQLVEGIETLPGVRSAAAMNSVPLDGIPFGSSFRVDGRPEPPPGESPVADIRWTQGGYFETMGIPLLRGRLMDGRDARNEDGSRVVVVNETLVRRMFPDEDPIGKRIVISWGGPVMSEIIGVVGDVKHMSLRTDVRPMTYWPHAQETSGFMYVIVRADGDPMQLVPAIRRQVQALYPLLPLYDVRTMNELLAASVAQPRFNMLMLGLFALVALILAAVGIYGVIAYSVTQRTREMGIRMALGAQNRDIISLVVRQGMILVVSGVALGLCGAFASTRVLSSLLFEVDTLDPATFGGIAVLLALVALLASYVPARRATRVDPIIAVRHE
jgi:putative ABC transport system permease protein